MQLFLGSEKELPEVNWEEGSPAFYLKRGLHTDYEFAQPILKSRFIYSVGSFMGCACGLASYKEAEDYDFRVRDIRSFAEYLRNQSPDNNLHILATWYENFPDEYPSKYLDINLMFREEFDFEEDTILIVKS